MLMMLSSVQLNKKTIETVEGKAYGVLLALLPVLHQFRSPLGFISLGDSLLALLFVLLVIRGALREVKFDRNLAIFYLVPIVLTLFSALVPNDYFDIASALTTIAQMLFYYFLVVSACEYMDIRVFIKCCFAVASLAVVVVIAQCAVHYLTNFELPVMRSYSDYLMFYSESIDPAYYYYLFGFRPAAFFTEPSYYVFYLTPLVLILLFWGDDNGVLPTLVSNHRLFFVVLFSLSMLFTSSSAGLIMVVLTLLLYFVSKEAPGSRRLKLSLIGLFAVAAFVAAYLGLLDTLILRTSKGASSALRITRGVNLFTQLDILHQVIGVGINNIESFIRCSTLPAAQSWTGDYFTSDLANRLVTSGVIGLAESLYFLFGIWRASKNGVAKAFAIMLAINFIFNAWQYSFQLAFFLVIWRYVSSPLLFRGEE